MLSHSLVPCETWIAIFESHVTVSLVRDSGASPDCGSLPNVRAIPHAFSFFMDKLFLCIAFGAVFSTAETRNAAHTRPFPIPAVSLPRFNTILRFQKLRDMKRPHTPLHGEQRCVRHNACPTFFLSLFAAISHTHVRETSGAKKTCTGGLRRAGLIVFSALTESLAFFFLRPQSVCACLARSICIRINVPRNPRAGYTGRVMGPFSPARLACPVGIVCESLRVSTPPGACHVRIER